MGEKIDKIELTFTHDKDTKRAALFNEDLPEVAWSDQDVAVGYLYVKLQALELIGSPKRLKVTIEPLEGGE